MHEIRRLVDEGAVLRDPGGGLEVEVDARVDAALAEVAVEVALVAVLVEELAQIAKVVPESRGRDGGILPPFPRAQLARHVGGGAEARLAHGPDEALAFRVAEDGGASVAPLLHRVDEFLCVRVGFFAGVAAELHEQPSPASGRSEIPVGLRFFDRAASTSLSSNPSRPIGLNSRSHGTSSAAR